MLFSSKKSILGVDIGTTSIKIAQVTTDQKERYLDTYGVVNAAFDIDENNEQLIEQAAYVLRTLMQRAEVTTNSVVASLPNSSVFTSVIELPQMQDKEIRSAVEFEAKKYVPLPLSEVTLSWAQLDKTSADKSLLLITAVPNQILRGYLKIFELAKLRPLALEIEALALIRSVIGDDQGNDLLIDIGAKSTHLNITEHGYLILSKNIPIGGETITEKISQTLKITMNRAEQFKKDFGLNSASVIPETMKPILVNIKNEVKQLQTLYRARGKEFDKIIIVGGGSNLPGLDTFFNDIGTKVMHGDPLSQLSYSTELKPILAQYAAALSVAIGLALRTTK